MRAVRFALSILLTAAPAAGQGLVEDSRSLTTNDGRIRSYDVYRSDEAADSPSPVLLVFHGGGGSKDGMPAVTCPTGDVTDDLCLNRLAALGAEHYLVVYPQGFLTTWNAGNCCGPAMQQDVDDVAFVSQLLDQLATTFSIDSDRVYATGISNGAMLSHRLACELSDRIAAIAPVAGGMGIVDSECRPLHPVPVLEFHGTADPNYPFDGGVGGGVSGTDFIGIPETIAGWVMRDGCADTPSDARQPDAVPDDGTTVWRQEYPGCADGARVVLDRIENGGHTWPDGSPTLTDVGLGIVSRDVNANEAMLEFFREAAGGRQAPRLSAQPPAQTRRVER